MNPYIKQLESNMFDLVSILTDKSLWNFLSDRERERVGKILRSSQEAKDEFDSTASV